MKIFGRNRKVKVSEVEFKKVINGPKIPETATAHIINCAESINIMASEPEKISADDYAASVKEKADEAVDLCKKTITEIESNHIDIDMKAEKNYEIEIDKLTDIVNAQLEVINIKNRVLGETKENLEKLIRAMDRDPKLDKIKKIEGSIKETLNSVNTLLQSTAKLANEYIIAVAKLKGDNKLEEV
jgi:ElaB/YqjD/DUF883 family membrane-anchored ribosome-binding protein